MGKLVAEHKAFFFSRDAELAENVASHVSSAFEAATPIVLVMTPSHRRSLEKALVAADLDPEFLESVEVLRHIDAEQCLERFTISGALSEPLFQECVGNALGSQPVHAYGEMVNVLCQRGRFDDAIELENMWNRLANTHSFSLLCGYATKALGRRTPDNFLASVCRCHSHVEPPRNAPHEAAMIQDCAYDLAGY